MSARRDRPGVLDGLGLVLYPLAAFVVALAFAFATGAVFPARATDVPVAPAAPADRPGPAQSGGDGPRTTTAEDGRPTVVVERDAVEGGGEAPQLLWSAPAADPGGTAGLSDGLSAGPAPAWAPVPSDAASWRLADSPAGHLICVAAPTGWVVGVPDGTPSLPFPSPRGGTARCQGTWDGPGTVPAELRFTAHRATR